MDGTRPHVLEKAPTSLRETTVSICSTNHFTVLLVDKGRNEALFLLAVTLPPGVFGLRVDVILLCDPARVVAFLGPVVPLFVNELCQCLLLAGVWAGVEPAPRFPLHGQEANLDQRANPSSLGHVTARAATPLARGKVSNLHSAGN
jgi:hypothetical protein